MRRWAHLAALALALAGAASLSLWARAGDRAADNAQLVEILSGIDFIPPRTTLDDMLGSSAASDLIAVARKADGDPGVRIRAYRALGHYAGPHVEAALIDAIGEHALAVAGADTIMVRAAMHALAMVAGAGAVEHLGPQLDHPVRDVRAAAAAALGQTGSRDAEELLRVRLEVETVPQVQLAILDAIRILNSP